MSIETLQKANKIKLEMKRLKSENDMLSEYVFQQRPDRKLEKIKPIRLFTKLKGKFTLKKTAYGVLREEPLFDLTKEDIDILFEYRLKKYHELKKELNSL